MGIPHKNRTPLPDKQEFYNILAKKHNRNGLMNEDLYSLNYNN